MWEGAEAAPADALTTDSFDRFGRADPAGAGAGAADVAVAADAAAANECVAIFVPDKMFQSAICESPPPDTASAESPIADKHWMNLTISSTCHQQHSEKQITREKAVGRSECRFTPCDAKRMIECCITAGNATPEPVLRRHYLIHNHFHCHFRCQRLRCTRDQSSKPNDQTPVTKR